MTTHGGARPGSGPKPKLDAMVKRMYVLRQDQVDWLDSLANEGASMSQVVRTALDCYKEELRSTDEQDRPA